MGKTLAELNFRQRYNLTVLLLERKGTKLIPSPDTVLQQGTFLQSSENVKTLISSRAFNLTTTCQSGKEGNGESEN